MSNENKSKPGGPGGRSGGPGTRTDADKRTGTNTGTGSGSDSPRRSGDAGRNSGPGSGQDSSNPPASKPDANADKRTGTNTGVAGSPLGFGEGQTQAEAFVVEQAKSKGGRPKGFSPKASQEEKRAEAHSYNLVVADALADVLSGVVQTFIAPTAAMSEEQKQLITEPLVRMMDRMAPKVLDDMQKYADPALLIVGLISYGGYAMSERGKLPKRPVTVPMTENNPGAPVPPDEIPTGGPGVLAQASPEISAALGGGLP